MKVLRGPAWACCAFFLLFAARAEAVFWVDRDLKISPKQKTFLEAIQSENIINKIIRARLDLVDSQAVQIDQGRTCENYSDVQTVLFLDRFFSELMRQSEPIEKIELIYNGCKNKDQLIRFQELLTAFLEDQSITEKFHVELRTSVEDRDLFKDIPFCTDSVEVTGGGSESILAIYEKSIDPKEIRALQKGRTYLRARLTVLNLLKNRVENEDDSIDKIRATFLKTIDSLSASNLISPNKGKRSESEMGEVKDFKTWVNQQWLLAHEILRAVDEKRSVPPETYPEDLEAAKEKLIAEMGDVLREVPNGDVTLSRVMKGFWGELWQPGTKNLDFAVRGVKKSPGALVDVFVSNLQAVKTIATQPKAVLDGLKQTWKAIKEDPSAVGLDLILPAHLETAPEQSFAAVVDALLLSKGAAALTQKGLQAGSKKVLASRLRQVVTKIENASEKDRLLKLIDENPAHALNEITRRSLLAVRDHKFAVLHNARGLKEFFAPMVENSLRQGKEVSIASFDLTQFKLINDILGPAEGDAVLGEFADTLVRETRIPDVRAHLEPLTTRPGGDEFVLVLSASEEEAKRVTDRILKSFRNSETLKRVNRTIIERGMQNKSVREIHLEKALGNWKELLDSGKLVIGEANAAVVPVRNALGEINARKLSYSDLLQDTLDAADEKLNGLKTAKKKELGIGRAQ